MKKKDVFRNKENFSELLKGMQLATTESDAVKGGYWCTKECLSTCTNCVIGACITCFGCVCATNGA